MLFVKWTLGNTR